MVSAVRRITPSKSGRLLKEPIHFVDFRICVSGDRRPAYCFAQVSLSGVEIWLSGRSRHSGWWICIADSLRACSSPSCG